MQAQLRRPAPGFLARWIRTSFAGWALGFVLILVLIALSSVVGLGDTQFPVGLGMGAGVGYLQGRALATDRGARKSWLIASALGMTLPFLVSDLSDVVDWRLGYSLPIIIVAGGFVTGLLQWRILRKPSTRAAWWIVASTRLVARGIRAACQ
jgi:hypothetical protein